jgi:hypothetical protein
MFYNYMHVLGIILTFMAYGMYLARDNSTKSKGLAIMHGVGLLILLISGGGMAAKLKLGAPSWMLIKIGLWVLLGVMTIFIKRKPEMKVAFAWGICIIAALAAYLGIFKYTALAA